jgi:hypothetical protein
MNINLEDLTEDQLEQLEQLEKTVEQARAGTEQLHEDYVMMMDPGRGDPMDA